MSTAVAPQTVYATLGLPNAPVLVSVGASEVERMIPTAIQVAVDYLPAWAESGVERVTVYCETGGDRSRRAVDALAKLGLQASYLEGGLGAWQSAAFATVRTRREFAVPGASRWVTRERPKVDRLACPWLVRRFIDPRAQFFYTAAHRVRAEAETLRAQPYDIADVTFSHRGAQCSFDAFLSEFDLCDPILDQVATIVRAADTGELSQSPQAHGLLAISLGLSANYRDDIVLLEQAMPIYDALYAWCKQARSETHSWPKQGERR